MSSSRQAIRRSPWPSPGPRRPPAPASTAHEPELCAGFSVGEWPALAEAGDRRLQATCLALVAERGRLMDEAGKRSGGSTMSAIIGLAARGYRGGYRRGRPSSRFGSRTTTAPRSRSSRAPRPTSRRPRRRSRRPAPSAPSGSRSPAPSTRPSWSTPARSFAAAVESGLLLRTQDNDLFQRHRASASRAGRRPRSSRCGRS